MGLIAELDKLSRAIKDSKIRLYSIKANIEKMDNEIAALSPRKLELEQNLYFLKKENTVPLAQEYKKSRSELSKTKTRLNIVTTERAKAHQATVDIELIIDKFQRDYEKLVISSENNILKGNFGGFRGKK